MSNVNIKLRILVQNVHDLIALCKEDKDCHKCYDCMQSNLSQNLWSLSKGTQPWGLM